MKKTVKLIGVNVGSFPEEPDTKPSRWKEHLEKLEEIRKKSSLKK